MTVDDPTPRWPAPASGGDEGCRRLVVAERDVSGKEAGFRVSGCVAARRARSVRGRSSAALTFPLVVVLRTYSPSRVPFEESYIEVTRRAVGSGRRSGPAWTQAHIKRANLQYKMQRPGISRMDFLQWIICIRYHSRRATRVISAGLSAAGPALRHFFSRARLGQIILGIEGTAT